MPDILPDEPLQGKLIRNWFRLYFFQFLIAPAGYLIKVMVSRELSVEDIGLFYSILWLIAIIATYNDLGLTEALQYYLPHYFIDKEYSKAKTIIVFTWLMQFVSWFIIATLLYCWADWLAITYFKTAEASLLLKYFALYFIIINLFQVISSLFIAVQNIKRQQWIDALRMWTVVVLTFISFTWWTLDAIAFTKRRLAWVVVALMCSWVGLKRDFWWLLRDYPMVWDRQLIKQQWSYGLRILIGVGAAILLGQVNQQFALYIFGTESAWYRTNYLSFYTIVWVVTGPVIAYLFPLLNELYKKWEDEKVKLLYRFLFWGIFLFWIVWGLLGYFFSEPLAVLLFGEKFRQSGVLFQHYAPFIFTIPLIGVFFQDLASRGMVKQRVFSLAVWLVFCVISSLILWKIYGLAGLVYGQLIGNLVLVMCGWYWYKKDPI